MNENQFEQFVAQMLSGMQSATDWTIETQRREIEAHDHKLATAEAVLRKGLDFVVGERQRLRGKYDPQALHKIHDQLATQAGRTASGRTLGDQRAALQETKKPV